MRKDVDGRLKAMSILLGIGIAIVFFSQLLLLPALIGKTARKSAL